MVEFSFYHHERRIACVLLLGVEVGLSQICISWVRTALWIALFESPYATNLHGSSSGTRGSKTTKKRFIYAKLLLGEGNTPAVGESHTLRVQDAPQYF